MINHNHLQIFKRFFKMHLFAGFLTQTDKKFSIIVKQNI